MSDADMGTIAPLDVNKGVSKPPGAGLPECRNILGVNVCVHSKPSALARIAKLIATNTHAKICFLNAHGANLAWVDEGYADLLSKFEVLSDGIGVDVGSLINYGKSFPANLNGTDFIPALLAYLGAGKTIALLGAEPGIAKKAIQNLQKRYPQHEFTAISHGYFSNTEETAILDGLKQSRPDILLVALGNPVQEKWIAENCNAENCKIAIGVGAYFDFAAGKVPRAPKLLRMLRLEWVYRLWLEPGRMWRRYVIGNPLFVVRSIWQKLGRGRNR